MFEKKLRSIVIVCFLAMMMLSAGIVIMPNASALTWTQDDDSEFSQGTFTNTEVVGTGIPAYVALVTGIEDWGDLDPTNEPSAREGPVMAYDSTRDVFIMFGGHNGTYLNDTWEYDYATNSWTEISTSSAPSGREWSSLAYDSGNDVFVLFGGFGPGPLSDTWEYDPGTQSWSETTPGFSPGTMYSYALAYDAFAGRVILGAEGFFSSAFETWAYDASLDSWVQRTPTGDDPGTRAYHTLTYMSSIGRTVLFGGVDGFTYLDDVYEYDYSADTWTQMSPGLGPSARFGHAAAYRSFDQSIVVYGGQEDGGGYPTDTWKYEYVSGSETWTQIMTISSPGARSYLSMDYDLTNNATVIFGGDNGFSDLNETWKLSGFYTSMGFFTSSFFDSLYTDTIYNNIWWNLTPSNQPQDTNLTFQIAVSNNSGGPWNFVGPDGSSGTYYTNPGEQIRAGTVGRYFRYTATLMTFTGLDTPRMDDVTITYTIPVLDPKIVETDPANFDGTTYTGIWDNITVYFSEPMAVGTLIWSISPNPGGWTEGWDTAETTLYLNHSNPFEEKTVHTIEITYIEDKDANALVSGPVPNPWVFVTVAIPPFVEETEPADNDVDIALSYPIWINFSEPMNTTSVTWTISPDPGGWTDQWQNGDKTLYLMHSTDYFQCQQYTVQVTGGKDLKDNNLVPGPMPNPWRFDTVCLDPFVQATDPSDGQIEIGLNYPITVDFSKEVDNTTLSWTISPDPGGWSLTWAPQNLSVVMDHSNPFTDCTQYTVEVLDIQDLGGGHLIPGPVPNPWTFTTTCPNPYILATDPGDGAQDVPTYKNITITFSKTVDNTTFQWTIDPDPGTWSETWTLFNTVVELDHIAPLGQCTDYNVSVDYVEDLSGNPLAPGPVPNPWTFNTTCAAPVITDTYPVNGSSDISLNAPIYINFSKAINTTTLLWSIGPDPGGWSQQWLNGNKTVLLTHSNPYIEATLYMVAVTYAEDTDGNVLVPGPVPNPWQFTTASANPYIVATDPVDGQVDVALDKVINITFSEPMNTATVTWTISPDPGGWTPSWLMGDTVLSLSHSNPFQECLQHTFNVTAGLDLQGLPLVSGPVPNPFTFRPICQSPIITDTYPVNGTLDFPVDGDLWINFSEPMDTATVQWFPNPFVGHQPTWQNNNQTLRLDHPLDYAECTLYEMTIAGDDLDGNPLVQGPVPNPFYYTTVCQNPYIVSTDPFDGETNVGVWDPIVIAFSEEMNIGTVNWTINPDPLGWTETWESNNTVLNLTHSNPFASSTTYMVQVTSGEDLSGLPLVPGPAPNPWNFTTESVNPYIVTTDPADGDTSVPLDKSIVIDFSKEIDTTTFAWIISPDPGGWTETWSNGNMTVTLNHSVLFSSFTVHTVNVTQADDLMGNPLVPGPVPNPWQFTTGGVVEPYIVDTDPFDGETGVALDACIWLNFSEQMNTSSLVYAVVPDPGGWSVSWTNGDQTLELCHSNPFVENTLYNVTVSAEDLDGNALIPGPVPNPWTFTTGIVAPWIVDTNPADGDVNVTLDAAIYVNFSEPMDTATLIYSVTPDPGGWNVSWMNGNTLLILTHANPFAECTQYTVTISAQDLQGQSLQAGPVPNPWSFNTVCFAPYILSTSPADGAIDVPVDADIIIQFSETIDILTFAWNISPDPGGWTSVWSQTMYPDDTVTLSHANPFAVCTLYTVTVTAADDMDGNALVSGPASNPWSFQTVCPISPPSGLTVTRVLPSDVRLDWNVVPGATSYNVYHSGDRFAPFPGGWNLAGTVNNFILFPHLADGLTHYYIVRAYNNITGESSNSTMGVKIDKAFTFNPIQMTIYWMSLPYNSEYATASDIATELTEGNVNVIAKWDRATQNVISYYWARGKWRGKDFTISPGDGIYVSAIANFNWYIVGTDSSITIDLPYTPQPFKLNKHYISVPYTGAYTLASDIVIDIEGGLGPGSNAYMIEVGLWDPASQSERTYTYTPTGWSGDNFSISPGDGVYIRMVATYNWQPLLLTPEVP
ncbi:MAG: Ig-like domain-containing protein [Thermoplasmata archaeon]